MHYSVSPALLNKIRSKVIIPLKDAMRLTDYKEHERNYKFHVRKKIKGSKRVIVFRSYTFKLKGTIKHEMYLKAINPVYVKHIIGKDYSYKIIITPNIPIDMEFDNKNKRRIELVIYLKKSRVNKQLAASGGKP